VIQVLTRQKNWIGENPPQGSLNSTQIVNVSFYFGCKILHEELISGLNVPTMYWCASQELYMLSSWFIILPQDPVIHKDQQNSLFYCGFFVEQKKNIDTNWILLHTFAIVFKLSVFSAAIWRLSLGYWRDGENPLIQVPRPVDLAHPCAWSWPLGVKTLCSPLRSSL
jgi:hypothetical protein